MSNTHTAQVLTTTTITTTNETVVAALPAFNTNNPGGTGVSLDGLAALSSTGAGTTAIVVRMYSAPPSAAVVVGNAKPANATLVGNAVTVAVTAATATDVPLDIEDTSAAALSSPTGIQYFATLQATGATGNPTVATAVLNANSATNVE